MQGRRPRKTGGTFAGNGLLAHPGGLAADHPSVATVIRCGPQTSRGAQEVGLGLVMQAHRQI